LIRWNLVPAHLDEGSGLRTAQAYGLAFHVISTAPAGGVCLTFDPSSVLVFSGRPAGSAQNVFQGDVVSLFSLADRTRVVVDIGGEVAADLTREAVEDLEIVPGRRVWLAIKSTAIQVHSL
jgi:molybdate transport system ATP-binding protein